MKKYVVIKPVRYQGRDLEENEIIELLPGSVDHTNLVQVGAIKPYVEPSKDEPTDNPKKNKK